MPEVIKRRRNYSKIALSYEECKDFLDSQIWLRVATVDSKEELWNLPTHFVRIEDAIYFDEDPESLIVRNIESKPNVCAVADTGYSYDDLVGTILQGEASIVEDKKIIDLVKASTYEKYQTLTRRPPLHEFANRKFVKIIPSNSLEVLSWDFGRGHL
ncbi:MAG TPA: pyridoxamine 5'-phosphate oxidase family protein [Nitrososphaerales archaeon]|nr:pyridoxamine 5'-phosphate oxidase family protein [Nitrososphaerales archaeon]